MGPSSLFKSSCWFEMFINSDSHEFKYLGFETFFSNFKLFLLMVWSWLIQCSATADFSGLLNLMCEKCSLNLVSMLRLVCPIYFLSQFSHLISYMPDCFRCSTGSLGLGNFDFRLEVLSKNS